MAKVQSNANLSVATDESTETNEVDPSADSGDQPAQADYNDPFDPANLKVSAAAEDVPVEKVLSTVPVRKPLKQEFFRVRPEPDFTVDTDVLEHDNGRTRNTYLVAPHIEDQVMNDLRRVRVFTCVNQRGVVFLWPAKLPSESSDLGRKWAESALMIAEEAKELWVNMRGSRDIGAYEHKRARGDLGEPQWPDKSFRDLLALGFGEYRIDHADHAVLRELRGER